MMAAVEIIFALIGVLAVIAIAVSVYVERSTEPAPEDDLASPYREGLHAALRIQTVAQELEQKMYAEAMRCGASGTTYTRRSTSTTGASVNYGNSETKREPQAELRRHERGAL